MIYGRAFSGARLFPIYLLHFYCPYAFHIDLPPWQRTISASFAATSNIIRVCSQKAFFFFSLEPLLFSFLLFYNDCSLVLAICDSLGPRLTLSIVETCLLRS